MKLAACQKAAIHEGEAQIGYRDGTGMIQGGAWQKRTSTDRKETPMEPPPDDSHTGAAVDPGV